MVGTSWRVVRQQRSHLLGSSNSSGTSTVQTRALLVAAAGGLTALVGNRARAGSLLLEAPHPARWILRQQKPPAKEGLHFPGSLQKDINNNLLLFQRPLINLLLQVFKEDVCDKIHVLPLLLCIGIVTQLLELKEIVTAPVFLLSLGT